MKRKPFLLVVAGILCFMVAGSLTFQQCTQEKSKVNTTPTTTNDFIGAETCKSCHAHEYNEWLQSHHFMAMQPANDTTVEGDFNNTTFSADGVTNRFSKKDGKFFISTQGGDGKNHDYEVKYIFGFMPLQQYLVEFPGGRMQVPRVSWDVKAKKWFHQYAGQKIPPHDWLHWTKDSQNWNTMCASCHSTNLQKNYNADADSYNTTYSQINVSCESCHGAGKLHVDFINSTEYKNGKKIPGACIDLGKNSGQIAQVNTCAPCHARKSDISESLVKSDELMDNYIPDIPTDEHYHTDGQANEEDYIYASFLQSKMFSRGVRCSNCHNPHSGKILFAGNQLCLQCHAKKYDDPSHTFHVINTAGSECKNCHMPGKFFMGNDMRYDHIFRAPRPDLSVKSGTPNACNNCHSNKSAQWAADAIVKWYGPVRKYHFAEDLIPGSKLDDESEPHLLKLLGDTSVPDIIKATAVQYLGSINTQNSLQALLGCLTNSNAQIRYRALRSLSGFPAESWQREAGALLGDKVRAVRIAAADLYFTLPDKEIPFQFQCAFHAAYIELKNYLLFQADFSVGNLSIADHYLQNQDYNNAEKYYLRALKKDSMMNYGRLNLSTAYSAQEKNDAALAVLESAVKIDPKNDRIYYNMALLYNEMKDTTEAKKSFDKAVNLKTTNPRVYYNYGLLLNECKKFNEAEKILQKGIAIDPKASELYYGLSFVYLQTNDVSRLRKTVIKLKLLDPDNPEYQELFKNIGM
jgi:tetratricopeptide (TPR) repeat protein